MPMPIAQLCAIMVALSFRITPLRAWVLPVASTATGKANIAARRKVGHSNQWHGPSQFASTTTTRLWSSASDPPPLIRVPRRFVPFPFEVSSTHFTMAMTFCFTQTSLTHSRHYDHNLVHCMIHDIHSVLENSINRNSHFEWNR
jgi:hypothetical protein